MKPILSTKDRSYNLTLIYNGVQLQFNKSNNSSYSFSVNK